MMELKTARLTLLVDPNTKAAFERLCAQLDRTASQVVRQLIRDYLVAHGVTYVASGGDAVAGGAPAVPVRDQQRPGIGRKRRQPRKAGRRVAGPGA